MSHYAALIATPLPGRTRLGLHLEGDRLLSTTLLTGSSRRPFCEPEARTFVSRMERYFDGELSSLQTIDTASVGTAYQSKVWSALRDIAPGDTARYGEIADRLGSGARAVANACRANPLPLVVPCHRVVAATGIGGYMGERGGVYLAIKEWLLEHEGAC